MKLSVTAEVAVFFYGPQASCLHYGPQASCLHYGPQPSRLQRAARL